MSSAILIYILIGSLAALAAAIPSARRCGDNAATANNADTRSS